MDHLAVVRAQRPVTVPSKRIDSLHHSYCLRLLPDANTLVVTSVLDHPRVPLVVVWQLTVSLQPYL